MAGAQTQNGCHLLRLPIELRLTIYEYLWPGKASAEVSLSDTSFLVHRDISGQPHTHMLCGSATRPYPLAVLLVCREIHTEALSVLYQKTRFSFVVSDYTDRCRRVHKHLPSRACFLEHIRHATARLVLPSRPSKGLHSRMDVALENLQERLSAACSQGVLRVPLFCAEQLTWHNYVVLLSAWWKGKTEICIETRLFDRLQRDMDQCEARQTLDAMIELVGEQHGG